MKIVIDFNVTYNTGKAFSIFTSECWQDVALLQPGHTFIFLAGEGSAPAPPAANVYIRTVKRTGIRWFDKKKLDIILSAWHADCYISLQGTGFNISFLRRKQTKIPPRADQLVSFLANVQEYALHTPLGRLVTSIKPACRTVVTGLSWAESESIKTQYTGGRSFFLFTGDISERHQLVGLLKAFSLFKKWQQSNMQLVIAGYETAWTSMFEEKLLTYKYKADVVIIKNPDATAMAKLVAACYAMLYPATEKIFPLGLILAIQSNKAVIASDTAASRQITLAAEWVHINSTADGFAKAMIRLFKDEKHLQLLVQQANEQGKQLNRRKMLEEVWQCIEK